MLGLVRSIYAPIILLSQDDSLDTLDRVGIVGVYIEVTKSYFMNSRTRINNVTCPIRIVAVAEPLGFKTIGAFYKFLKQCNPTAKLYFGISHMRVLNMRKIVEAELGINPYQHSS